MAFLDKVAAVAKNIGGKASGVVESTKLSVKISSEKDNILENQRKIGEYFYQTMKDGPLDDEVKGYFESITASYTAIEAYEKEKEAQKSESGSIFDVPEDVEAKAEQPAQPESAEPVSEAAPEPPAEEAQQPAQPDAEEKPEHPPAEDGQ